MELSFIPFCWIFSLSPKLIFLPDVKPNNADEIFIQQINSLFLWIDKNNNEHIAIVYVFGKFELFIPVGLSHGDWKFMELLHACKNNDYCSIIIAVYLQWPLSVFPISSM